MKKTLVVVLAILALSIGAFAQAAPAATEKSMAIEINGSYQFTRLYADGQVMNTNPGWNASIAVPVYKSLSVLGSFSGTDVTLGSGRDGGSATVALNTYGGGLQYTFAHFKALHPYANFVIADARFTALGATQSIAYMPGAGIDWRLTRHFYLRTGVEYLHTSLFDTGVNGLRPIGGLTFRF